MLMPGHVLPGLCRPVLPLDMSLERGTKGADRRREVYPKCKPNMSMLSNPNEIINSGSELVIESVE
jgi:hypothetical protein